MAAPFLQAHGGIVANTTGNMTVSLQPHALNDIVVVQMGFWGPNSVITDVLDRPAVPDGWTEGPFQTDDVDGMLLTYWIRAGATAVANPTFVRPAEWDTGTDTCWWARTFVVRGVLATESPPWRNTQVSARYIAANGAYPAIPADTANDRFVLMTVLSLDNQAHGVAPSGWTDTALGPATTTTGTDGGHSATSSEAQAALPSVNSNVAAPAQGYYSFIALPFIGDVSTGVNSEVGTTNLIATDAGSTEILLTTQSHDSLSSQAAAELLASTEGQTSPSSQSAAEFVTDAGTSTATVAHSAADAPSFQYARPTGDVNTAWTPVPGSPATLWDKVDDATADDADYIRAVAA